MSCWKYLCGPLGPPTTPHSPGVGIIEIIIIGEGSTKKKNKSLKKLSIGRELFSFYRRVGGCPSQIIFLLFVEPFP